MSEERPPAEPSAPIPAETGAEPSPPPANEPPPPARFAYGAEREIELGASGFRAPRWPGRSEVFVSYRDVTHVAQEARVVSVGTATHGVLLLNIARLGGEPAARAFGEGLRARVFALPDGDARRARFERLDAKLARPRPWIAAGLVVATVVAYAIQELLPEFREAAVYRPPSARPRRVVALRDHAVPPRERGASRRERGLGADRGRVRRALDRARGHAVRCRRRRLRRDVREPMGRLRRAARLLRRGGGVLRRSARDRVPGARRSAGAGTDPAARARGRRGAAGGDRPERRVAPRLGGAQRRLGAPGRLRGRRPRRARGARERPRDRPGGRLRDDRRREPLVRDRREEPARPVRRRSSARRARCSRARRSTRRCSTTSPGRS